MRPRSLLSLFFRSLFISAVTVGGGYVILSALRRFYTVRKRLISDADMDDITVIAQSAPGAVAVNAALLVGYRLRGVPGALVSVLGTLIPPTVVMSALAVLEGAVRGIPGLSGLMTGMRAGAAAVILDTALDMTRSALLRSRAEGGEMKAGKGRELSPLKTAVFAASLWLCLFTGLSSVWILLAAALAGGAGGLIALLKERSRRFRGEEPLRGTGKRAA